MLCVAYLLAYEWAVKQKKREAAGRRISGTLDGDAADTAGRLVAGSAAFKGAAGNASPNGAAEADAIICPAAMLSPRTPESPRGLGPRRLSGSLLVPRASDAGSRVESRLRAFTMRQIRYYLPQPWMLRTAMQLGVMVVGGGLLLEGMFLFTVTF